MKPVRYIHKLKHDSRPKLFGYATPGPVRVGALQGLEDRPVGDFLVRHALKDCPAYSPRFRLLDTWKREGHWGVDRFFMGLNGEAAALDRAVIQAVKNLIFLDLYHWPCNKKERAEGYLDETAHFILSRSSTDGYLNFISKEARWASKKHSSVYRSSHWPGLAVTALVRFGIKDPAIDRFYLWLMQEQRHDGGWLPQYYARQTGSENGQKEIPSHPLHTSAFARAMSADPGQRKSGAFQSALKFLLANCFHSVGSFKRSSAQQWTLLAQPNWGFDALTVLSLAADAGIGREDNYVTRILDWLTAEQRKNGYWLPRKVRRGVPDEEHFLTLKATVTVKRIVDDLSDSKEIDDQGFETR